MTDILLGGDVMLGRGVDQILPAPGDPTLRERAMSDARGYVELAERANGAIPAPVTWEWVWGDALELFDGTTAHARVVNLETSVTRSDEFARGKGIHYRMSPENISTLTAANIDVCSLANNHVLDLGRSGLAETLEVLSQAGVAACGAGRDGERAWRPAVLDLADGGRLVVLAVGLPSSGIPTSWAAGPGPGIAFLPDASSGSADRVLEAVDAVSGDGDIVVVSVHWGSNWGYEVPDQHARFARRLVAGGVDVVHGHSSHHPRPVELHGDRPVLYGCGDLVNDYEGIRGHERYRGDLRLAYQVSFRPGGSRRELLRIHVFRARRMRLERADGEDVEWTARVLDRFSRPFGTRVEPVADAVLVARPE